MMEYEFPSYLKIGKRDEKKIDKKVRKIIKILAYFLLGYSMGIIIKNIYKLIK